ncbi:MAG: regulator [Phenylobacterium sp.]|nr:regulator [Phenylobacterium sp.]
MTRLRMPARAPKVLVIDDDDAVRDLIVAAFSRLGCEVQSAPDGRAGVRLFNANPADLVVTDILMPNQEGIETILQLKRGALAPKVIAISGGGSLGGQDFLKWARNLGADATLPKPFRTSELIHIARGLLEDATPCAAEDGDGEPSDWAGSRHSSGRAA